MKRYAFIDVLNTINTTEKMLNYSVDWEKVAEYLKYKQSCSEIVFYIGIDSGDIETAEEFDRLSKIEGIVVKSKPIFSYKNRAKKVIIKCKDCGKEHMHRIGMGYTKKSNCDVELAVDTIEKASEEVEFIIFTGDGDFEYLIRASLEKGVSKVSIFSYAGKDIIAGMTISRYSTKLRKLVADESDKVFYVSLRDFRETFSKKEAV